jgi:hypothetical protein
VAPLAAQQQPLTPPDSGARVRLLRTDARAPQTATLVTFARDTLLIQPSGCCALDTVPLSGLRTLEVSRGKRASAEAVVGWMGFGLLTGAGVGAAAGKVYCNRSKNELCGLAMPEFMMLGAGVGLVVGGVIGARHEKERWERIYPPPRAALWVVPQMDRTIAVGLMLTFGGGAAR